MIFLDFDSDHILAGGISQSMWFESLSLEESIS